MIAHQRPLRTSLRLAIACGCILLVCGCAGYQFGTRTLYAPDVSTVYVPMFESDSFRRYLGERLTEAVIKEIELKTPYEVVGSPNADSILTGRIVKDTKRVLIESITDDPRAVEIAMYVEVTWVNSRGDLIREPFVMNIPPNLVRIGDSSAVIAEAGQSIATGQQDVIEALAEQIVSTMETPW